MVRDLSSRTTSIFSTVKPAMFSPMTKASYSSAFVTTGFMPKEAVLFPRVILWYTHMIAMTTWNAINKPAHISVLYCCSVGLVCVTAVIAGTFRSSLGAC